MIAHLEQSRFIRRQTLARAAIFDSSVPSDLREQLWNDPLAFVHTGDTMSRTNQRRTYLFTWGSKQYVLKQYRPTYWHLVRQLPTRSWSAATFHATTKLIDAGIPTPRPLASLENRWGGLRRDSFLIYEYVEGITLRSYLEHAPKHPRRLTEHLSRQISDLWRQLADLRASLADAHTGNFIICPAGRLWVIDLDKTRFHRTTLMATLQQKRGWQRFVRSASKYASPNVVQRLCTGAL